MYMSLYVHITYIHIHTYIAARHLCKSDCVTHSHIAANYSII